MTNGGESQDDRQAGRTSQADIETGPPTPPGGLSPHPMFDPTRRGSLQPSGPISELAPRVITVPDWIAIRDAKLRRTVALVIVTAFVLANAIVLLGVWFMFQQEVAALRDKVYPASDRVITGTLLMTIVGATTVQLGARSILMGKYLFPPPRP